MSNWLNDLPTESEKMTDCLTAWQMDRSDCLTDWLTDRVWQTDWMPDRRTELIDWLPDKWTKLIVWLTGLLSHLLTEWLTNITVWRFYWISEKLTVSPIDWLIEGQTDRMTDKLLDLPGDTRFEWLIGDIYWLTDCGKQWICGRGAQSGWLNDSLTHWLAIRLSNWSGWN